MAGMVARGALDARVFDASELQAVYQPIVHLLTGEVVGAEALARWPRLELSPETAFRLARAEGRVEELDLLCQRAALRGTAGVDLPEGFAVFVNVEPDTTAAGLNGEAADVTVIAEITERALLDDPAKLLRSVRTLRSNGCGIALDDVGAIPDSLSLLPFLDPDVIKLDISLVQAWPGAEQARILTAVAAHAERSGATVLAEGIETRRDYEQALALGATLGQGWYFSRPGPLVSTWTSIIEPVRPRPVAERAGGTPFGLLGPGRLRVGTKGMLLAISRHIEQQGLALNTPPVVLSAFQDAVHFTPATARRYVRLARRCPLVVALGAGLDAQPAPGVRGAELQEDDGLRGEWSVVVVGSHYSGALIALDLGDSGPELERRFTFTLTHHYATVIGAAKTLLQRVEPAEGVSAS